MKDFHFFLTFRHHNQNFLIFSILFRVVIDLDFLKTSIFSIQTNTGLRNELAMKGFIVNMMKSKYKKTITQLTFKKYIEPPMNAVIFSDSEIHKKESNVFDNFSSIIKMKC